MATHLVMNGAFEASIQLAFIHHMIKPLNVDHTQRAQLLFQLVDFTIETRINYDQFAYGCTIWHARGSHRTNDCDFRFAAKMICSAAHGRWDDTSFNSKATHRNFRHSMQPNFVMNLSLRVARTYLIANVLRHHALLLLDSLQILWILPAELWRQRNNHTRHPNKEYHHEHSARGPRMNIIHIRDRPISGNGEIQK